MLPLSFKSASYGHRGASGMKCSNNLRQLSLAAIQYSDDKRFLPHIAKLKELDGGYRSTTAARVLRALTYFNYDDSPETYCCPSSAKTA